MKYGAIPENVFERLALAAGKVPVPAMDALFSIMKARVLMTAVRLGVFEALRDAPRTPAEVASARGLDPEVTGLLLRALVFGDYLEQRGDRFALSRLGRDTMIEGAPMDMRGFVEWTVVQWEFIEHMEELVRTGRGLDFHDTMSDPERWGHYQRAMLEIARFDAPILAARVPVRKGARRLLDVAGSHGLLGAAICRKHPPMRSVVLDLPSALEHARKLAREAGVDDVVEHRVGNLETDDFGTDNDVVLLANILHHFQPDEILAILRKAAASLSPAGTVAVWDLERPRPESKAGLGDGTALFFRLTSTASCYSGEEYARWMKEAGLKKVRIQRPLLSPAGVLVTGRTSSA